MLGGLIWWVWQGYALLVLLRVVLSWTAASPYASNFHYFVHRATEPVLAPIRRHLRPEVTGGLDFSPLVVLLLGGFVARVLAGLL